MTTYTFGSDLQNTFDITALGVIKTGKITGKITPLNLKNRFQMNILLKIQKIQI